MDITAVVLLCVLIIVIVVLLLVALPDLWFRALVSGTYVPLLKLFRIRIKRLDARLIVMNYIKARKSGVDVTVDQLETHVQAKGNLDNVVNACIAAVNGGIDLPIRVAMAIDLSGRDIKEAVRYTISPRVIETSVITAICKNGIELAVRAKITLKANLERLIGGVGEETVVARVSEGIVTLIGNTPTHTEFLEKTDVITKQLTDKTVSDEDAAFEVLSIDISKIEIGRNVGAELDIDLAESRKIVAQADAEQRRTDALAAEQEMRAITQEMRARVVAAEALLPQALAEALERGNISPTDYYKLDNLISDSQMRKKIAGSDQGDMLAPPRKKSKLA